MKVEGGLTTKLIHSVAAVRAVLQPTPFSVGLAPSPSGSATGRHCIVLHGYGSPGYETHEIQDTLRAMPCSHGWQFWDIHYDAQWHSAADNARRMLGELERQGGELREVVLVGYSMGGIIARQLVALGLPCRGLVTICSPHHGPVPWMPTAFAGPRSVSSYGPALRRLNQDPRDIAHRDRYHFFAITFRDALSYHDHDGWVTADSALGRRLGSVAHRERIELEYDGLALLEPHWRGRFARYVGPALRTVERLLGS